MRLAVGGGHPMVLRAAARHADVVALGGLGRTLPDGHLHQVRWSAADLRYRLRLVREEALRAGTTPIIEAFVHHVVVTGDRAAAAEQISKSAPEASADDIARTPFVLIGSHEQMAGQLQGPGRGVRHHQLCDPGTSRARPRTRPGPGPTVSGQSAAGGGTPGIHGQWR